jgi:hypothetical protein
VRETLATPIGGEAWGGGPMTGDGWMDDLSQRLRYRQQLITPTGRHTREGQFMEEKRNMRVVNL